MAVASTRGHNAWPAMTSSSTTILSANCLNLCIKPNKSKPNWERITVARWMPMWLTEWLQRLSVCTFNIHNICERMQLNCWLFICSTTPSRWSGQRTWLLQNSVVRMQDGRLWLIFFKLCKTTTKNLFTPAACWFGLIMQWWQCQDIACWMWSFPLYTYKMIIRQGTRSIHIVSSWNYWNIDW